MTTMSLVLLINVAAVAFAVGVICPCILFLILVAKRSGVPQGCLPSVSGSAGAGADARNDSLNSSVVPREQAEPAGKITVARCPFCGGKGKVKQVPYMKTWHVCCDAFTNKCPVSPNTYNYPTVIAAVKAWNTRADASGVAQPALPPQGERALARNGELCDLRGEKERTK